MQSPWWRRDTGGITIAIILGVVITTLLNISPGLYQPSLVNNTFTFFAVTGGMYFSWLRFMADRRFVNKYVVLGMGLIAFGALFTGVFHCIGANTC